MIDLSHINLVLLVPHGRAGSYLIQSLFDGHEEVTMFPGAHNHYHLGLERFATNEDIARTFVAEHLHFFDSSRSYFSSTEAHPGDEVPELYNVNTEAFVRAFVHLLDRTGPRTDKTAWLCAHLAFAQVRGHDTSRVRYLFIHQHILSADLIAAYFRDFPDLYYIAPTRDIREEWSSCQKLVRRRYGTIRLFDQFLEFLKAASASRASMLTSHGRCSGGHFKIIDLARLHLLQEDAMRQFASWLGISYDPALVESTIMGVPWLGNASDGKPIAGFDRDRARSKYREVLDPTEQELAEFFFDGVIEALGYPPPRTAAV